MSKIVNLTPHEIVIISEGNEYKFPPSGTIARVSTQQIPDGFVNSVPVVKTIYGVVEGVPESQPDTFYIVSGLVQSALQGRRSDILVPNTAKAIRDENGNIIGVPGFTR